MKPSKTQIKRMNRTFEKHPIGVCMEAYDLNRGTRRLPAETIASSKGLSTEEVNLMINAYETHLSLDVEPPEPNPVGTLLKAIATIEGVEGVVECQDVLVKECLYCPFNYCGNECCAARTKPLAGEPRDEDNFPEFCLLKKNPILIRRSK